MEETATMIHRPSKMRIHVERLETNVVINGSIGLWYRSCREMPFKDKGMPEQNVPKLLNDSWVGERERERID